MIAGTVTQGLEAVIGIAFRMNDGTLRTADAVIDTGFSGYLALPEYILQQVGEPDNSFTELRTADDSMIQLACYRVVLNWFGSDREVKAYAAGNEVLVGMKLLLDCRLIVDVRPDGAVELHVS